MRAWWNRFTADLRFYLGGRVQFVCPRCGATSGPWDYRQYRWIREAHAPRCPHR